MNLEKTGFSMLDARNIENSIDIDALERQYGLKLPPIYRLFIQTYYLGEKKIHRETYWNDESNDFSYLSTYSFAPNPNVGFSHFNDVEKSFEIWSSGWLDDTIYKKKYFPIASGNFGGIYLGLDTQETDKIIFDGESKDRFTILSDNIFDFMRSVSVQLLDEKYLSSRICYEQLYKKWGEEFWRVGE